MEKSTNVKSLTAMFNAAPSPMEGAEKSPGIPPLNSFQARRAEFAKANNLNSGTLPKKPVSPKPPQVPKSASDEIKHPALRPVGINRFGGSVHGPSQDSDVKPTFPKPPGFKTFEQPKDEPKVPFPKPIGNKPLLTTNSPLEHKFGVKPPVPTEEKQKPAFPKPSAIKASSENEAKPFVQKKPTFGAKPSLSTVGSPGEVNATKPGLVSKTFSNSFVNKPAIQTKETPEENLAPGPTSQSWVPLRPTGIKQLQSTFLKQNTDEPHDRAKQGTPLKDYQAKVNHDGGNSQPPVSIYPRFPSTSQMPPAPDNFREQKDSSEPKRKSLPTLAQLGPPPPKPARPPNVDIERYRSGKTMGSKVAVSEQKSSALSSALPPPPPPVKSLAGASLFPSLPPRNIGSTIEDHKHEDGAGIDDISEESDEECYEGIDDSAQYKREQEEKNEKKRKKELEQAKREQKEKEKKEQEIRKRFRLTEKIEVIHQAQANMDYKGSKNELSFRNGDQIEIIRVTDNPEGKWLGRMKGNYGYIKTAMVKVDYDSLPRKNPTMRAPVNIESEQDIYDDVGEQDSVSNNSLGGNSYFPPPPSNGDDEIYDGVDDGPADSSVPQEEEKSGTTLWNIFRRRKGTENKKKPVQDKNEQEDIEEGELANSTFESDVYDDVDSSDFPPPPIELGLPVKPSNFGKSSDLRTIKKLEKEEKEFRKKFKGDPDYASGDKVIFLKFTGDIRVLSSVQVVTSLAAKKWGSKDLPLKPGEILDVIQHANDTTLLCKNNEGKYGYVSKINIIDNDGEIYDDIGEDCIYDND